MYINKYSQNPEDGLGTGHTGDVTGGPSKKSVNQVYIETAGPFDFIFWHKVCINKYSQNPEDGLGTGHTGGVTGGPGKKSVNQVYMENYWSVWLQILTVTAYW